MALPSSVPTSPGPPAGWGQGALVTVPVGDVTLESGVVLPDVRVALQSWGTLDPDRGNAVLVAHALTGDSHVVGPVDAEHPSPGWWPGLVGPGAPLDTDRWFVVAANVLGGCRGTTGPGSAAPDGSPWADRFPAVSIRDQVTVEVALADALGIASFAAVVGGSMGGMRALEWAVGHPERVRSALVLATGARATADQIGTQTAQVMAIENDPDWLGGRYHGTVRRPGTGMGIARRIAHLSYRGEVELDERFGADAQVGEDPARGGRYAVQSYLDHQARRLVERFDPASYVVLTRSMNGHDVGRGRGGVAAALGSVRVPVVVAGVETDRLYPLRLQAAMAEAIPTSGGLRVVRSMLGHDGFLVETGQVGELLAETVALA